MKLMKFKGICLLFIRAFIVMTTKPALNWWLTGRHSAGWRLSEAIVVHSWCGIRWHSIVIALTVPWWTQSSCDSPGRWGELREGNAEGAHCSWGMKTSFTSTLLRSIINPGNRSQWTCKRCSSWAALYHSITLIICFHF